MQKVKHKLWIWGHEAGSHNNQYGIKGASRMTPTEGALYLDVPNLIMVRYVGKPKPPFEQYALPLSCLDHLVWSIYVDTSSSNDLALVLPLATHLPNLSGVIMDDFFQLGGTGKIAPLTPGELSDIRKQLTMPERKLDLWVTLYTKELNLPIQEYLSQCDVVTLWTWRAKEIDKLERNLEQAKRLSPSSSIVLGCYMWDYGDKKPMPVSLMQKQCQLGLQWLRERRIKGMIFLASCICDLELEAVEWTRGWIQEVGGESLNE